MAELSDLQKKYGAGNLTPEQMLYMEQLRPKSGSEVAQQIIRESSPDLKPAPGNFFQRASEGARIAGDLVNKYLPKAIAKVPKTVTSMAPLGFVGTTGATRDFLMGAQRQADKSIRESEVPSSINFFPSVDTMTGEMRPAGFGEGRVKVGKVMEQIKPADLLGLTGAQKTYSALGYGQAPEPLDVLDTLGLQAGMYQAGRAGLRSASTLARAGAPYAAEGLTNLVSKYGVDPRMNILPDTPSMSDAVPKGFKLGQENGKAVVYDASGKIFAKGDDAKSAIFRANKRLENEAANAARAARREERAAEASAVEEKPLVKVDTDDQAPLFYNPLAKAAANLGEDTDPLKVLNDLKSFDNVTDDQITFSGIADYLERKAEKNLPVTREEVQGFIDENRIKLYEHLRDGNSGRYEPDDLEIAPHRMETEDPDDAYLRDIADNEEEYVRNNYYDEIYNEIRENYPDLDEERVQEKVEAEISDRAWELARDYYYENPVESGTNDAGYQIMGNRDQGYTVVAPNGRTIDTFYNFDEANEAILQHAVDEGLLGDPNSKTLYGEKQYPAYMMPGGRNYRELNIGLQPGSKDKTAGKIKLYDQYIDNLQEEANAIRQQYPIIRERPDDVTQRLEEIGNRIQVAEDLKRANKESSEAWYGSHFEDEPDLFAQLRLQDYQDVDGMSGTLIDEAQSDMHQKGREKGYRSSRKDIEAKKVEYGTVLSNFQEDATKLPSLRVYDSFNILVDDMTTRTEESFLDRLGDRIIRHNNMLDLDSLTSVEPIQFPTGVELEKIKSLIDDAKKTREISQEIKKMEYGIPDAPFKKDWYHVAIRRAIKDAIDNGKDRVYLPTGEALADRYNYATAVDQIAFRVKNDGKYSVTLKDFDGNWHQTIGNQSFSNLDADELDGIFGKAMADKMRNKDVDQTNTSQLDPNDTTYLIENQNIDVGGKGFKKYYDEIYPNFMKKEAKEFDAKTGYTKIPTPVRHPKQVEKLIRSAARRNRVSVAEMQQRMRNWSQSQQDDFFNNRQEPVFYIEINDAMREAYGKGRPYARGGLVTDALDAVEEHFQKGGKVPAKNESEAKNIEPVPLLGRLAGMLGESSEFLKSRPLKEEGSWQAKGAASAVNSVLELVDQFFVNDLAKTADRMAYGFPVTSGKGETLKPLPETTGAVLTVAPPALKVANKAAKIAGAATPLMQQTAKQSAETVFDMLERYAPQPMYVVPKEESKFLPTILPRTRRSPEEIEEHAIRVARQMSGEHVRNPRAPKDASNLAGRSMKESQRLQALPYTLEETKVLSAPDVVTPQAGSMKIALPGDITVSDKVLVDVAGRPIRSVQEGGPFFGQGKLHLPEDESLLWASEKGPAQNFQNRVNELAEKYGISEIDAHHLAMGPVATNFAMHFADANLKAINSGKVTKKSIQQINKLIRDGFQIKKGDDLISYKFKDFPGVENPDEAYKYLRGNSEARKWFNNRMKTPAVTEPLGLPNAQDIQWAISDPVLRNMEINLTGRSVGRTVPYAQLTDTAEHGTYGKGIRGRFKGTTEYPVPLELGFSDAWDFTKARKRPQDITGTLQKVFPHQVVDQQYLDEIGRYNELVKKYIGKKEGGIVDDDDSPPLPPSTGKELTEEDMAEWRRKSKAYEERQYWKRRGPNSADEDIDSARNRLELEAKKSFPMRMRIPKIRNWQTMPEVRDEEIPFKRALRYYQQGGGVKGVKITETYSIAPETKKQKRSKAEAAFANWSDWQNMPRIPREAGAPGYKGLGYFGRLPSVDEKGKPTYSTELAGEMDGIHFPLLVPTLSKDEVSQLLAGKPATDAIWKKAYEHALMRGRGAKSPFATQYDMPVERPR